jgi:hypothetical protein
MMTLVTFSHAIWWEMTDASGTISAPIIAMSCHYGCKPAPLFKNANNKYKHLLCHSIQNKGKFL